MTTVGKILAFCNLVFSVGTLALIAIVYSTRTNWKTEYERIRNTTVVLDAALKEAEFRHKSDLNSRDEEIATLKVAKVDFDNQLKAARDETERVKASLQTQSASAAADTVNQKVLQGEVVRLAKERELLGREKQQLEASIIDLGKQLNDSRKVAVDNDNKSKSLSYRNEKLLEEVEKLTKDNTTLRKVVDSNPGLVNSGSILNTPVPAPAKDVRGSVTDINASNSTVSISIGRNQSVNVGNKLQVFRINSKDPNKSVYLGEITLTVVQPTDSIGRFEPVVRGRMPTVGDTVAASISGR